MTEEYCEDKDPKSLFCYDLPTAPDPGMGKILVTGASGYIGGRLVPELLARGYDVRVMVRAHSPGYENVWPDAEVVVADALKEETLDTALEGITAAYYLIHSMLLGPDDFARADIEAASNFRKAADRNNVKRIIYLGGLGDVTTRLSKHLKSRMEVAEELQKGDVQATILRAAVIIGSGSASYEIIKNLVKKVPVFPVPPAAKSLCQPISIRDVVKYLVGVLETPATAGEMFDIGGEEVMTYIDMLKKTAGVLGKRRIFLPVPFFSTALYSYLVSLLTPVPGPITRCLMEGIKNDVVCRGDSIRSYVGFKTLGYEEAIVRAMSREERDRVRTRWSNAYPPAHDLAMRLCELDHEPKYTAYSSLKTTKEAGALFSSICRIGGPEGWFHGNWLWRLRGAIDRIFLGVGTSRGRREFGRLEINDVVDFWRVEDIKSNERLLLRAEMKMPGKGWLEFGIEDRGETRGLSVTAWYDTATLLGIVYWYVFLPFHRFIFKGLIEQIEERS